MSNNYIQLCTVASKCSVVLEWMQVQTQKDEETLLQMLLTVNS